MMMMAYKIHDVSKKDVATMATDHEFCAQGRSRNDSKSGIKELKKQISKLTDLVQQICGQCNGHRVVDHVHAHCRAT